MLALIDGNNFYASCERVFQPELRGKALVVLSNNDGCIIARSDEAKALGIKMGQPLHEISPSLRKRIILRSANFTLYGDMSARVLSILRQNIPRVEPYSIDECFLDVRGIPDRHAFLSDLSLKVHRYTGIPNCIGVGSNKTLAKLGNHIAKSATRKPGSYPADLAGVADLGALSEEELDFLLQATAVKDVWGVGGRYAQRLKSASIHTAMDLKRASTAWVKQEFGVVLARTQKELHGIACQDLIEVEPDRQQIMVSRSFGALVEDHAQVHEALATFAIRACEKLRQRGLSAAAVSVFVNTNWLKPDVPQHHPQRTMSLPYPSADTRVILAALEHMKKTLLRTGFAYKKAGVALLDLGRSSQAPSQGQLFIEEDPPSPSLESQELMAVIDAIGSRFGKGKIGFGASGWRSNAQWSMKQQHLSGRFSTSWGELPEVLCW